ncbi:hypothetical protein DLAC_03001 [Tieghemostelium lacteum]|uniref:Transmembrane protein n=1 Tax=Tieghemostelium lacteum TaxID=361077 RepID=A0A152A3X7_TIELA|nr:hypothetical protein DLAC_03001 [Tieghemostelium lacteum]|eukprot:KYR00938.1 hypothetical protein DLAC_03001 [Tieghemostelium lacteum]
MSYQRSWGDKLFSYDNLRKIQAGTGIVISTFAQCHMLMIVGSHISATTFEGIRDYFRIFYQNKYIEPIILGSIAVHMGVNIYIMSRRDNSQPLVEKLSPEPGSLVPSPYGLFQLSSLAMMTFIGGHVSATRLPVLWNSNYSLGFKDIYYTLRQFPQIFLPYYQVFLSSLMYHTIFSYYRLGCRVLGIGNYRMREYNNRKTWYTIFGVCSLITASSLLAIRGHYYYVNPLNVPKPMTIFKYAKSLFN